jgi:hypothetical protein
MRRTRVDLPHNWWPVEVPQNVRRCLNVDAIHGMPSGRGGMRSPRRRRRGGSEGARQGRRDRLGGGGAHPARTA